MEPIIIKGKIEFLDKEKEEYSREFTATLQDSGASNYGNNTQIDISYGITKNGKYTNPIYLDTRYDKTIKKNKKDFKNWIQKYFKNNFARHNLTIY